MIKKDIATIPLFEAIERSDECLLCYLWKKTEERHVRYILTNEVVMSPEFRDMVLAAKGFCNHHMHLLYERYHREFTEDGLGYALYLQGVIQRISKEIESISTSSLTKASIKLHTVIPLRIFKQRPILLDKTLEGAVQGRQPCPICEHLWESDKLHIDTLLEMLNDRDFLNELKSSSKWMCLPHFVSTLMTLARNNHVTLNKMFRSLIEVELKHLQLLQTYISEFIRKFSWEFRHEPRGPEQRSNKMILNTLVGEEGLYCRGYKAFAPWESEGK